MIRKLASILTLLFGAFNLIMVLPILFTGFAGAGGVTEVALYVVMLLLGAAMITGGILGLTQKKPEIWKKLGFVIIGLALVALLFNLFMGRGVSWSNLFNAIVAFAFIACVKQ